MPAWNAGIYSSRRGFHGAGSSIVPWRGSEICKSSLGSERDGRFTAEGGCATRNGARNAGLETKRPDGCGGNQILHIVELRVEGQDDDLPVGDLLGIQSRRGAGRRRRGGRVLEHDLGPTLENLIGDVELPVDCKEEGDLILVDLLSPETRDLAPGTSRVVAVLEVFRSEDESGEEHTAPALQGPTFLPVIRLLHGEIMLGHVRFDEHEVVQCNLKGGVTGPRAAQRLLDESAQGKDGLAAELVAADNGRQGPDGLDDLG